MKKLGIACIQFLLLCWFTSWLFLPVAAQETPAGTIGLNWSAATEPPPPAAAYVLHYGRASGQYDQTLRVEGMMTTAATITGLDDCVTWYAGVKAESANGNFSESFLTEIVGLPRVRIDRLTWEPVSGPALSPGTTYAMEAHGANFQDRSWLVVLPLNDHGMTITGVQTVGCRTVRFNLTIPASVPEASYRLEVKRDGDKVYGAIELPIFSQLPANVSGVVRSDARAQ